MDIELTDFAEALGLEICTVKRRDGDYYAHFSGYTDVADGVILIGAFGDGATPFEALRNYAKRIRGKKMRVMHADRSCSYFGIPGLLTHTKKLKKYIIEVGYKTYVVMDFDE